VVKILITGYHSNCRLTQTKVSTTGIYFKSCSSNWGYRLSYSY